MRLNVNWTVKHKGKRYEPGETIYVDEEAAEALLGSGACRYYDGPDAAQGDEREGKPAGKKAGGKATPQATEQATQQAAEQGQ